MDYHSSGASITWAIFCIYTKLWLQVPGNLVMRLPNNMEKSCKIKINIKQLWIFLEI